MTVLNKTSPKNLTEGTVVLNHEQAHPPMLSRHR